MFIRQQNNEYTKGRLWRSGLAGMCSYNIERVRICLTALYLVHVALNIV